MAVERERERFKTEGGAAFPLSTDDFFQRGMSLRDWFAGQALAVLAVPKAGQVISAEVARVAYLHADAMIEARKPKTEKGEATTTTGPDILTLDVRTSPNAHQGMPFMTWKYEVDHILVEKTGMSGDRFPDFGYWDAYDSGESPSDAADDAIRNAKEN